MKLVNGNQGNRAGVEPRFGQGGSEKQKYQNALNRLSETVSHFATREQYEMSKQVISQLMTVQTKPDVYTRWTRWIDNSLSNNPIIVSEIWKVLNAIVKESNSA